MAYEIIRPNFQLALRPEVTLCPRSVVKLVGTTVVGVDAVSRSTDRPFGVLGEATAAQGVGDGHSAVSCNYAEVREEGNIVKAIAGASLGVGAEVGLATIGVCTAVQGGSNVATVTQLGPISTASGVADWAVGIALEAAADGSLFTLYVKPRQIGGLI